MTKNLEGPMTIALAGNPNCGKTTIFNALTGSNQHVGNYSGVTVEKKDGYYKCKCSKVQVIDLPGTYSLNYHSPEERIAQEELLSGKVDVVVAIVDASALSRSLTFVAQLMLLNLPMVLCLNMSDESRSDGQVVDVVKMKQLLGMEVIETVASKGEGIDKLKEAVLMAPKAELPLKRLRLGDPLRVAVKKIADVLPEMYASHRNWAAHKILLGEVPYLEEIKGLEGGDAILELAENERKHIEADAKMDIQLFITEQYYGFVDGLLKAVLISKRRADARATSDKIDSVLAHPLLGIPFFFLFVYLLFEMTFTLGQYPMDWIETGFNYLSQGINSIWPVDRFQDLRSLIVDGIIGGVGGVVIFLPNILILFFGISFLEDCGYMARGAFIMDRMMHRVGLHGRSFIPLITGFGCTIPGIMATRTIAGEKERLTTMFVLPLMSCGARVPIWLLLVPAFFPQSMNAPILMGIYLFGVLLALLLAFLLRKTAFSGEEEPFVMELPPYRLPTLKSALSHMFERAWLYLKKAGTLILAVSIILWALMTYPRMDEAELDAERMALATPIEATAVMDRGGVQDDVVIAADKLQMAAEKVVKTAESVECASDKDAKLKPESDLALAHAAQEVKVAAQTLIAQSDATAAKGDSHKEKLDPVEIRMLQRGLEHTYAGRIGKFIEPVIAPMGFDWKIGVALIGALAAKEVFVAQMGIIYSLGEVDEASEDLRASIRADYSVLTGISLIIFLLISAPCMATFVVMRRESGSTKLALLQFWGLTLFAYVLATAVYQIGTLFS